MGTKAGNYANYFNDEHIGIIESREKLKVRYNGKTVILKYYEAFKLDHLDWGIIVFESEDKQFSALVCHQRSIFDLSEMSARELISYYKKNKTEDEDIRATLKRG